MFRRSRGRGAQERGDAAGAPEEREADGGDDTERSGELRDDGGTGEPEAAAGRGDHPVEPARPGEVGDDLRRSLDDIARDVDDIAGELAAARRDAAAAYAGLQRERDDLLVRLARAERQRDGLGGQLEEARREAETSRARFDEERARLLGALDAERDKLDAAARATEVSNDKLKQALKQLVAAHDLRAERDELRRANAALEARLQRAAAASRPAPPEGADLTVMPGSAAPASSPPPARPSPQAALEVAGERARGEDVGDADGSTAPWRAFLDRPGDPGDRHRQER